MKGLIFTYVLTYGGALLALFNPYFGLLIYLCFAILRPEYLWPWSVTPGNYSRIVAIGVILGWALKGFGNWNFGAARPFVWTLLAYWGCIIVSALQAANQTVAWNYVALHSKILLPVFVGLTLIESVSQLKQLAWVLVLSLGYLAFEGNLDHFRGGQRVWLEGMGGIDNNSFSIAMASGSGLAFFFGLRQPNWWSKLLCFAIAAMMVHTPMFANSRGGMLGVIVTGVVTLYLIPKRPRDVALVGVAALVGLRLAGRAVWERFSTTFASSENRDESAESRLQLWADCWDVMQKHPLTGIGPDHWPLIASQYGWRPGKECHSLWFNAGAELGFPGLLLLILFYGIVIWHCWGMRIQLEHRDSWFVDCGRMVTAALVGFFVSASFVSLDTLEPPYYIALLGAGALKVFSHASVGIPDKQPMAGPRFAWQATAPQP